MLEVTNVNAYKFVFRIKSPHWDEKPNEWKKSKVITLGQILDDEQLDFPDGTYMRLKDINWQTDTVVVIVPLDAETE
jgi:hypothetical protein